MKKFAEKEKVVIFAARFDESGSSLKILKDKYKQVPRTKNRSRALISLEIKVSGFKLENKKYTKKSLILAQDER